MIYTGFFIWLFILLLPTPSQAKISANHKAGAVIVGSTALNCDPSLEGALRWSSLSAAHEMCDGYEWMKIRGAAAAGIMSPPTPGTGYFVLRSIPSTARLFSLSGMNDRCLTELTDNDWLNKDDAVARDLLTASKVKGFGCSTTACNNLQPDTIYTFAVSGQPLLGGASFLTDSSGRGPGNTQNWTGTNYFGMDVSYWTNREDSGDDNYWGVNPHSTTNGTSCYGLHNEGSTQSAVVGYTNKADAGRWNFNSRSCANTVRIICYIDP